jgi:riboflavin kinase/FMN adenylyltransferase
MRVLRHVASVPGELRGAVVAIGNFDGIHRGHQELIGKAQRLAAELGAPSAVLTFEPHPRTFFDPGLPPIRLTTFRVKLRLVEALGIDVMVVLAFNQRLARLAAEEFVHYVLVEGLGVRHVVVGDSFRFGRKRLGDVALLEKLGRGSGFGVTAINRIAGPGAEAYSSSMVREYLRTGNPTRAALLLGRYWEIEGRVRHGAKRGRALGYPTANIDLGELLRAAYGVYAVRATLDRRDATHWIAGVANLGIRPMFETAEPLLEVHLFDFDGDLYGRHMRVALIDYLRPEMRFESLDALKRQMAEDSRRARVTLAWEEWDAAWPASPFMTATIERSD